ncbi:MAG: (d)CMP kinase [Gammaproteobacteria bacterium]|nr:(d)CMP kinase [Gammaproteobacteria bacterium]MCP5201598.1 (d)CMP kinase [Gammaproteobacteria bacterium]
MGPARAAPVIAIDGPSGTGKGTIARLVKRWLGWHLLDSGALYRVLGFAAERRGLDLDDEQAIAPLALALDVAFVEGEADTRVVLDGADATDAIRTEACGALASRVAAHPAVRAGLLERQRAFRLVPGLVADGRDMGTVVFPDAELKIFLTASAEERARRRHKQLIEKGLSVNLAQLLADITERDRRDTERAVSPLKPATDAVILDTTHSDISAVEDQVKRLVRERGLART